MGNHIDFSCVECDNLRYVSASRSYVCLGDFVDLKDTDMCMRCKFTAQIINERRLERYGRFLRLAQDALL